MDALIVFWANSCGMRFNTANCNIMQVSRTRDPILFNPYQKYKRDPASPRLSTMNDEITKATLDHKRRQWRELVESTYHRIDSTKLWRTIKGIDGKSKQTAENEGITFTGRSHTSPKLIANSYNRQFTTSTLGKHSSSRRTRHVSKDVKRMSLEQAESFTSDQVTSAIKSCRSSRVYGPDTLSIFHLKNLGPLATEHLTALYNDSLQSCRLLLIWKTSLVIPIPKPGKDSSHSFYPLSTNLSHQLKINTASDPETRLNLPSSSSQRTSRQAATSGKHHTVCGHRPDGCLWYSVSWYTDIQGAHLAVAHSPVAIGNLCGLLECISMVAHRAIGNKIDNIIKHHSDSPITIGNLI